MADRRRRYPVEVPETSFCLHNQWPRTESQNSALYDVCKNDKQTYQSFSRQKSHPQNEETTSRIADSGKGNATSVDRLQLPMVWCQTVGMILLTVLMGVIIGFIVYWLINAKVEDTIRQRIEAQTGNVASDEMESQYVSIGAMQNNLRGLNFSVKTMKNELNDLNVSISTIQSKLRDQNAASTNQTEQEIHNVVITTMQNEYMDVHAAVSTMQKNMLLMTQWIKLMESATNTSGPLSCTRTSMLRRLNITQGCQEGWWRHSGSCYHLGTDKLSWQAARTKCCELGGYLAMIGDANEDNFIIKLELSQMNMEVWLGASDIEVEGEWKWLDGQPVSYTNWHPSEPNNNYDGENCLQLRYRSHYQWNDCRCGDRISYMCESPLNDAAE